MKFKGSVQKNAVMITHQNSPSDSTPSTLAGFGGFTPFCNRTLIPLLPGKHKGNPQNSQTGVSKSLQPFQKTLSNF